MGKTAIYALCHPSTGEVRYIGQTSGLVKDRLNSHMSDVRRNSNKRYVFDWIRSLGSRPTIRVLLLVSNENGARAEMGMIAFYKARGHRLTNLTEGGEGQLGHKQSAELRAKRARWMVGNKNSLGHKLSDEHKAKIGVASKGNQHAKGVKHSPEARAKKRVYMTGNKNALGYKHTPEACANMRGRKSFQGPHSLESRAKMSASLKGKPWTAARREAQLRRSI